MTLLQELGDLCMRTQCRPAGDDYSGAIFSMDEQHRYALWRRLSDVDGRICCWIMLNPSTADEVDLDPTLRRCFWYTKYFECTTMLVGNLYAFRATDPKDMLAHPEPVGEHNDDFLLTMIAETFASRGIVVAGWGNNASNVRESVLVEIAKSAAVRVGRADARLQCLVKTRSGRPGHPGRIANGLPLQVWP